MDRFVRNILAVALMLFASAVSSAAICDRSLSRWPALASCNTAGQDVASQFVTSKTIASKKEGKRDAFRMPAPGDISQSRGFSYYGTGIAGAGQVATLSFNGTDYEQQYAHRAGASRVWRVSGGDLDVVYTHKPSGQVASIDQTVAGVNHRLDNEYYLNGRKRQVRDSAIGTTNYEYSPSGRLLSEELAALSGTGNSRKIVYDHYNNGARKSRTTYNYGGSMLTVPTVYFSAADTISAQSGSTAAVSGGALLLADADANGSASTEINPDTYLTENAYEAHWDLADVGSPSSWPDGIAKDAYLSAWLNGDTELKASVRIEKVRTFNLSETVGDNGSVVDLSASDARVEILLSASLVYPDESGAGGLTLSLSRIAMIDLSQTNAQRALAIRLSFSESAVSMFLSDMSLSKTFGDGLEADERVLTKSGLDDTDMLVESSVHLFVGTMASGSATFKKRGAAVLSTESTTIPEIDIYHYTDNNEYLPLSRVSRGGLNTLSYGYDGVGNMSSRSSADDGLMRTFTRDPLGRVSHVQIGASETIDYKYRLDGWHRVSETTSWNPVAEEFRGAFDTRTKYFGYSGSQNVFEMWGNSATAPTTFKLAAEYFAPGLDDITLQRTREDPTKDLSTQYLTKGGTGHVGLVVDPTKPAGERVVQSYRYDAFGNREFWDSGTTRWLKPSMGVPTNPTSQTEDTKPTSQYGFQGQRHDTGLGGMMFFRNRSYEPETGQFLSPDPAGIPDGPNMYSFGGMTPDPVNGTDPMGLDKIFKEGNTVYWQAENDDWCESDVGEPVPIGVLIGDRVIPYHYFGSGEYNYSELESYVGDIHNTSGNNLNTHIQVAYRQLSYNDRNPGKSTGSAIIENYVEISDPYISAAVETAYIYSSSSFGKRALGVSDDIVDNTTLSYGGLKLVVGYGDFNDILAARDASWNDLAKGGAQDRLYQGAERFTDNTQNLVKFGTDASVVALDYYYIQDKSFEDALSEANNDLTSEYLKDLSVQIGTNIATGTIDKLGGISAGDPNACGDAVFTAATVITATKSFEYIASLKSAAIARIPSNSILMSSPTTIASRAFSNVGNFLGRFEVYSKGFGSNLGNIGIRLKIPIDRLSQSARMLDRGGFSAAGRSLTKHGAGARPGNALFPKPKGNPAAINAQAQQIVDDILTTPNTKMINGFRPRYGKTIEFTAPDGRGLVYDSNGKFLFFKE